MISTDDLTGMDDPYRYAPASPFQPPMQGPPVTWGTLNPPQNVPGGWSDEHTGGFTPANNPNSSGAMDLSYWASRGVPADQIFDFSTGQTRPGWKRTGQGYERESASTTPTSGGPYDPIPTTYGTGGGRVTSGADPYGSRPDYSQMLPYPAYQNAPPLAFDPFTASSWSDAENEPGYQASRQQLRKQIEAGAAYQGMLRSGMTIGDLYSNLDALSQQNFRQFDDRRFRNWSGNLGLAKTKHDYVVSDIDRANNYRFNVADASFKDVLDRWKTQVNSLTQLARPVE